MAAAKFKAASRHTRTGGTRDDTTNDTRRYTSATRDTAIGLDLMGARFYAPDLGIWTSGDPIAINDPERSATEQFGTANPYAYANLNPVTATDPNGEFWHIAIGAGIGAVVGGGVEAARQYYATGHIEDWGRVGASAGGGAVSGAITAAVPTVGVTTFFAVNGGSGAAGGLTQRLIASGGQDAGTLTDVIVDAGVGVATAGVFRGASAMIRRVTPARPAAAQMRALDSEAAFKRQYGELGRGARQAGAIVDEGKLGYLLGHASGRAHNVQRAIQNASQLARIGVHDTFDGRALLQSHLRAVAADTSNVARTFSNQYGNFAVKESLFAGPGGFLKFESTWQVLEGGAMRLTTVIPFGG